MTVEILVHGINPQDIKCDDDGEGHPSTDHATAIADRIHRLLQDDFGYLDVDGVSVNVSMVDPESAPDVN